MRIRTASKVGASLVAAVATILLMATPASAGTTFSVVQPNSSGGAASWAQFVDDPGDACPSGDEALVVKDYAGGFGIEAQVYARYSSIYDWQWIATARATDGRKMKCISIAEGMQVKLSTWKYNAAGPDKWNRISGFGEA